MKANETFHITQADIEDTVRQAERTGFVFSVSYWSNRLESEADMSCQSTYLKRKDIQEAHETGEVIRMPERDTVPEDCVRVTPTAKRPRNGLSFAKDLPLDSIVAITYAGKRFEVID